MEYVFLICLLIIVTEYITASFQGSDDNHGSDTEDDEEIEARKAAQTDEDMILVD